ncbi:MAG: 23S rRNA pseudouridine(955/2504/2580) synthase RluC [Motiliproteus sp.]|nr:23S rRNA pseudouridine(955/2504/2580) synthase RluC [Motiliproteus sp.]MCW9051810.1 23S rRNA pseudouridine(955/2504/2580) synthase RluC [Motiliproteus sp.]
MSDTEENKRPAVRWVEIDQDSCDQRIDNFLIAQLKGVPKTMIYRILRKGEVRVNKKRVKAPYRLQPGDLVRIPPVRVSTSKTPATVGQGLAKSLEESILFENDQLLVVNKPSGLAVHGGSGISLGLIEALRQMRPQSKFLELVHRLDRDTSGCVMVAKKRSALKALHADLREGRVDKIYQALVVGRWPNRKRKVNAPLRKNELKSGERVVKVSQDGKDSLTEFQVLRRFADVTLIEAKPITGRTHQIRVHTQFAGHPIIGDDKYGDDELNKRMKQQGIKRLFLHAHQLKIRLPNSRERITVSAPLDKTLENAIEKLPAFVE